jgi:hypothetical protein
LTPVTRCGQTLTVRYGLIGFVVLNLLSPMPAAGAAAPPAPPAVPPAVATGPSGGIDDVSLMPGTPSVPAADVDAVKQAQRRAGAAPGRRSALPTSPDELSRPFSAAARSSLTGFVQAAATLRSVADGALPYQSQVALPAAGDGLMDSAGVRVFRMNGSTRTWQHPVGQAHYSLRNLDAYRLTRQRPYLERAIRNAQRMIDNRVESAGGWFFPYDFDFSVHGDTTMTLRAPWYSGMAQGMALSAFVRLHRETGQAGWRAAADATFASLLIAPAADQPWTSWVDGNGRLWLEEYPRWPTGASEMVLNGHLYAAFGLYDYFRLSGNTQAYQAFCAALATVDTYLPRFRRVAWASAYSLAHGLPSATYHQHHVDQLLHLQQMTGLGRYADWATTLRADYPRVQLSGTALFGPRSKTAYQLDRSRRVVRSRQTPFRRTTSAPVDRRERVRDGRVMLRVSAGPYTNWWFPESPGISYRSGPVDVHPYDPSRRAYFSAGTYTASRYDSKGLLKGRKSVRLPKASSAPTTRSAVVDGRLAFYYGVGAFAGHWVAAESRVSLS